MGIAVPILALVVGISNLIVGRLIVGDKRRKVSDTDGKAIQSWGLTIIAIICVVSVLVIDISNANLMKWFWLGFLTVLMGFQIILEWKFLKDTKEYLISLIVLLVGLIYIFLFIF